MIKSGNETIENIYCGNDRIVEVYSGTDKVATVYKDIVAEGKEIAITDGSNKKANKFTLYGVSVQSENPSPEYPQEWINTAESGIVNVIKNNNGYLMKGSYYDNVQVLPLEKGKSYYITSEKQCSINTFIFNNINNIPNNSGALYGYGYNTLGLKTSIEDNSEVNKPCRLPGNYKTSPFHFTVIEDGLYLCQAVNNANNNHDNFYVGYNEDFDNVPYQEQTYNYTLLQPLQGVPVRNGAADSQNVIIDGEGYISDTLEVYEDGSGKIIQRCIELEYDGSDDEDWEINNNDTRFRIYVESLVFNRSIRMGVLSNIGIWRQTHDKNTCFLHEKYIYYYPSQITPVADFKTWLQTHNLKVLAPLATPIEIPLTASEVEQILINKNSNITNSENAHMKVEYIADNGKFI